MPGETIHFLQLVSVVVPCYNQARFLGEAIDSVLAQTCPASQIIVVDDGSVDDTVQVATSYDFVQCLSQPNRGQGAARNEGLNHVTGNYVVFLDSDDRLLPRGSRSPCSSFLIIRSPPWSLAVACPSARMVSRDTRGSSRWLSATTIRTLLTRNIIWMPGAAMIRPESSERLGASRRSSRARKTMTCTLNCAASVHPVPRPDRRGIPAARNEHVAPADADDALDPRRDAGTAGGRERRPVCRACAAARYEELAPHIRRSAYGHGTKTAPRARMEAGAFGTPRAASLQSARVLPARLAKGFSRCARLQAGDLRCHRPMRWDSPRPVMSRSTSARTTATSCCERHSSVLSATRSARLCSTK